MRILAVHIADDRTSVPIFLGPWVFTVIVCNVDPLQRTGQSETASYLRPYTPSKNRLSTLTTKAACKIRLVIWHYAMLRGGMQQEVRATFNKTSSSCGCVECVQALLNAVESSVGWAAKQPEGLRLFSSDK